MSDTIIKLKQHEGRTNGFETLGYIHVPQIGVMYIMNATDENQGDGVHPQKIGFKA